MVICKTTLTTLDRRNCRILRQHASINPGIGCSERRPRFIFFGHLPLDGRCQGEGY